jgi:hypothetical protein
MQVPPPYKTGLKGKGFAQQQVRDVQHHARALTC